MSGDDFDVVKFPDIAVPPSLDEADQYDAMVAAVRQRGGLSEGENLTAIPAGSPPPGSSFTRERVVTSPTGKKYDIYTRYLGRGFSEIELDAKPSETFAPPEPVATAREPVAGQEALQDIDDGFSGEGAPGATSVECAFAKGFVKGAVVGYAVGFVLGALGPVGAAIGIGLLLYSVYETATHWDEIKAMTPEQKAELIGELIGGVVGGGLGARRGMRVRARFRKPPKTLKDIHKGRQDVHKPGTNEHKTRTNSPKGKPTGWRNPGEADALTLKAYQKGKVTERFPDGKPKEVKWNAGEAVGEKGETQITVKLKQNGQMHGFPSGPKVP